VFHGICIDQKVIALDGSESPLRIVSRSLLASEKLAPFATLNKVSRESVEVCEEFQFFAIY
jgi:tripeptidyl-peptidase-2